MKLEIRIEAGGPILFFHDIENRDKSIPCYTKYYEHGTATRAYMRSLAKPTTAEELRAAWALLGLYAAKFTI